MKKNVMYLIWREKKTRNRMQRQVSEGKEEIVSVQKVAGKAKVTGKKSGKPLFSLIAYTKF